MQDMSKNYWGSFWHGSGCRASHHTIAVMCWCIDDSWKKELPHSQYEKRIHDWLFWMHATTFSWRFLKDLKSIFQQQTCFICWESCTASANRQTTQFKRSCMVQASIWSGICVPHLCQDTCVIPAAVASLSKWYAILPCHSLFAGSRAVVFITTIL